MSSWMRRRVLVAVAIATLSVSVLSGCSTVTTFIRHTVSPNQKPSVGDCWTSTIDTADGAAAWTSGGAVACVSRHQLITYAVVTVKSSAPTWRDKHGDLSAAIQTAAFRACNSRLSDLIVVPDNGRLMPYFFVAPEKEWKKGARWVRCDIGVLRTGSLYSQPELARLPDQVSTLVKQAQDTPELFESCVTTTDPSGDTGPLDDPQATIADCTGDYQWQYQSSFTFSGDSYPSDDEFNAAIQTHCGDGADADGRGWIAYGPNESQWKDGDRGGECWYYVGSTPQA